MIVSSYDLLREEIAAITAGPLAGVWVHLYKNPYYPDPSMTLANFTESSFLGYAAKQVTSWTVASLNVCGAACTWASPSFLWRVIQSGAFEQAWGYYVTNPSGVLLAAESFGKPVPVTLFGQSVSVTDRKSVV